MKTLNMLAICSALTLAMTCQAQELFVDVGGGLARLNASSFTQTTSYGETLKTTKRNSNVGFAHIGFGYRLDENWDVTISATKYATAKVDMSFPTYPGIFSILPMPAYSKNVLKYNTTRFALIPSYTLPLGDHFRLIGSAGVTASVTDSHFETTYYAWFSGRPNGTFSDNLPKEKYTSWNYAVSLAGEYAITKDLSIRLRGGYSPFKIQVTPTLIAGIGAGTTQPSTSKTNVECFETTLGISWRH
jgi:hypothetical protein